MDKPDNYPDIVYKYRSWKDKYHKKVLIDNELYLASPKDFNDPFDLRIPIDYSLLDSDQKIDTYVVDLIKQGGTKLLEQYPNWDETKVFNYIKQDITEDLPKVQSDYEDRSYEQVDKHYGILSMSERWDKILMWSHYADKHFGYCVGFWEEKLRNSGICGNGGQVSYDPDNKFPRIDPMEKQEVKAIKQTHSKAYDWEYENEYRLSKISWPDEFTDETRTCKVDDELFAEVIIGLRTTEQDRNEIISIAKQKAIKVFQVVKVPWEFKIDREEIE